MSLPFGSPDELRCFVPAVVDATAAHRLRPKADRREAGFVIAVGERDRTRENHRRVHCEAALGEHRVRAVDGVRTADLAPGLDAAAARAEGLTLVGTREATDAVVEQLLSLP